MTAILAIAASSNARLDVRHGPAGLRDALELLPAANAISLFNQIGIRSIRQRGRKCQYRLQILLKYSEPLNTMLILQKFEPVGIQYNSIRVVH